MNKKFNIGIIGCGSIAKLRHAPEYAMNPFVTVAAFFDYIPERARALAEKFGGKVCSSLDELISDKNIDAVSVCTTNATHAEVTITALEAGKHVLCEKPIAASVEEAQRMVEAANKSGKFLMIGHNQRLARAHVKAKEILQSGELGRVLTFRTAFGHPGPESWSIDNGPHTWFFKKGQAVMGCMGDLGIHKADLMRWLLNDEFTEVTAKIDTLSKRDETGRLIEVDDNALAILKTKTGIMGTLTASWTYNGSEDNSTVLYCENGTMKIYDSREYPLIVNYKNREKVFYKLEAIATNEKQTSTGVIDLFVKSLVNDTPPEISGEEGLKSLKVIAACFESSAKNATVKIN